MSEEGNQKISLVRLTIGVVVLCVLFIAVNSFPRAQFISYFVSSVGVAVVVNIAARPNLAAKSSVVMCVASFFSYTLAFGIQRHLHLELSAGSSAAVAGFVGATLFAMAAHGVVFRRPDPAMSLFVGALTVPAGFAFRLDERYLGLGYEDSVSQLFIGIFLFHLAWYVLFAVGLGAAAALRGRTVGSRL